VLDLVATDRRGSVARSSCLWDARRPTRWRPLVAKHLGRSRGGRPVAMRDVLALLRRFEGVFLFPGLPASRDLLVQAYRLFPESGLQNAIKGNCGLRRSTSDPCRGNAISLMLAIDASLGRRTVGECDPVTRPAEDEYGRVTAGGRDRSEH